jgi:hypothetical protein
VDADGVVGTLAVTNPLDVRVLLYEGEELVGAKQNRILGQTILVAAGATQKIPATCVERRPRLGRAANPSTRLAKAPVASRSTDGRARTRPREPQ